MLKIVLVIINTPREICINILIIRTSSIGDIVFSLPILPAIKNTYSDAKITWVIDEDYRILIKNEVFIDKIIIFPKRRLKEFLKKGSLFQFLLTILSLKEEIQSVKYDLVLDLQGLLRTSLLALFSKSQNKISLGSEFIGRFVFNKVITRDKSERISSEYYELARVLGFNVNHFEPYFTLDRSIALESTVPSCIKQSKFFVIFPFTTKVKKHWIPSYWEDLVQTISGETGLKCVLLGSGLNENQKKLANRLSIRNTYSLVDQTDLLEAATIISNAKFCIGVDTGLTHISVSMNKPTIAIFLSTCPYLNPVKKNTKIIWSVKSNKHQHKRSEFGELHTPANEVTVSSVLNELNHLVKFND